MVLTQYFRQLRQQAAAKAGQITSAAAAMAARAAAHGF
jgi:hypothetical protein